MAKKSQLSRDAHKVMGLLCRANRKERLSKKELNTISGLSVRELANAGLLDLPVELVDMQFQRGQTMKLVLRHTQDILLTELGRKYCAER